MTRTLEEYMALPYRMEVVEDADEGGFVVSFPDLPGCLTCADTLEQALSNAVEAKRAWLAEALADGYDVRPPSTASGYSGRFVLRMPASLHKKIAEDAALEGVSMNQYCVYLLTRGAYAVDRGLAS